MKDRNGKKDDDDPPLVAIAVRKVVLTVLLCVVATLVPRNKGDSIASNNDNVVSINGSSSVIVYRLYVGTTPMPTTTPAPTPTPIPTSTPIPSLTPTIGPLGDVNGNPAPAPPLYPWADYEWRDFASHIVAGECSDCPEARAVVACTLVRDVLQGWKPYDLTKRWYGWMTPKWDDRMAVWDAIQPGGCNHVPHYRFVGNESDYNIWLERKIVLPSDPYDWYGNTIAVK